MTGACNRKLDRPPTPDGPNFSFLLVDFLLLLPKGMGWDRWVGKNVFQSVYLEGGSSFSFIFLSYFYSISVSLAQSKFNWLIIIRCAYSGSYMDSSGSILGAVTNPPPWHTREWREELEKVTPPPSLVKRLCVPLGYQRAYITDYNNLLDTAPHFTQFPWGSSFQLDPWILFIHLSVMTVENALSSQSGGNLAFTVYK